MRTMLENVWHPIEGVSILDLGDEWPWNFNSHLLELHRLYEREDPMTIQLYWVDFWMLIYDLLHGLMSTAVAKQLGKEARSPKWSVCYVHFEYEKVTLFFFLCGKLGHGESFCSIRTLHPRQEYKFQWDISLRVQPIKNAAWRSRWLVEDDAGRISNYGNSTNKLEGRNLGISQPVPMNQ
ncbi:hypothetical protein CXB51_026220 [Gossypium anomalum]|uniref:Zinc knuckle CX2CX4HX4C domain-containing protein n=1 Tax=Gossypium anomalum TaxID=47600 RepID=A0A8J5YB81_9ROSI|nr:hypothetical protein CXB51_026220 [Gossypium anomalum]